MDDRERYLVEDAIECLRGIKQNINDELYVLDNSRSIIQERIDEINYQITKLEEL
jgi:hypothetical protein